MNKKHIILGSLMLPLGTLTNEVESEAFFNLDKLKIESRLNKTTKSVVNIEDENLLKAINSQLGRGEVLDTVTLDDMQSLTTLNAKNREIVSIKGLENATNLVTLDLSENQIVDVSYLSSLTSLKTLYLYNNQISNILAIENLSNLTYLHLENNQILDISILENLNNLTYLYLSNNKILDIQPLRNLIKLKKLELAGNQISDISAVKDLTSLNSLTLHENKISDISSLENLTNLSTLHLYKNQISDISTLEKLTSLTILNLGSNEILDISPLKRLSNLEKLQLYTNQISDISTLNDLTNLTHLDLNNNKVSDISILENLTNLNNLCFNNNKISDISPLKNLTYLNILHLRNNQISDISPLENLTSLKDLRLYNNQISDISPLENLNNLTTLALNGQKPNIDTNEFRTGNDSLNIKINNPIIGVNGNFIISNISNNGIYEDNKLTWNNLSLGNHTNTFNFSQDVTIGSVTTSFDGVATVNFDVKKGIPDYTYSPEFDTSSSRMYITLTNEGLGGDVSHIIHRGARHDLPYRFKYDSENLSNNIIEVHDTIGNIEEYQVKLNDNNISEIELGVDSLAYKSYLISSDIKYFRNIVNDLEESSRKDLMQDKLNSLFPDIALDRESVSANVDIYIKCENMLSMSLNTNSITFDNFSGVEDMEMLNAVEISINSSLPYSLNAYIEGDIQNSDKSTTMDKSILNIREKNSIYQAFRNDNNKLVLNDNCDSGNNKLHNIDLKLSKDIAHKKDVYKTTIKFEVVQK